MKADMSGETQVFGRVPPKVLRRTKRAILPAPAVDRHQDRLDQWRHSLWRSRHKFMVLPGPQYRELTRKMLFSMEKAGLHELTVNLQLAIFFVWFFTGSVQKVEEIIVAVFTGQVFLLDSARLFLSQDTTTDMPKSELVQRLLLYDPKCYPDGSSMNIVSQATRILRWMGAPPEVKPWIMEWVSEMEQTRRRAATEIGKEAADVLWSEVCGAKGCGNGHRQSNAEDLGSPDRIAYW